MRKTLLSIALAAVAMLPNVAQAQLVEGSPFCEATVTSPGYTECWGSFAGNNIGSPTVETNVANFLNGLGYGTWTEAGTTNAGQSTGPFESFSGANSGTLTFDVAQTNPFIVALKGSNRFSFFYFANDLPITSFTYTMDGVDVNAGNGTPNGLSHATLYTTRTVVPEPATFGLVAVGMIGLAGVARRRRNQA